MSLNKNQFFRLTVIDELLGRKNWVKTVDIKKIVSERLMEEVSIRTIQNDLRDLKENIQLGYFAPISYDTKKKAYRYTEKSYSIKNFGLREEEITAFKFYTQCLSIFNGYSLFDDFSSGLNKIIQGVSIRNRITNTDNIKKIIQTDSLIVSKGNEFLGDLVYAIDNQLKTEIEYQSFEQRKSTNRIILPYFIKEYKHRWYLLGVTINENAIKTFAFDRIKNIRVSEEKFSRPIPFDSDAYFKHSFGITTPNDKVEYVVLRFDKSEAPYISSLPIHPTQKIIKEGKSYLDISIEVRVSYELIEYILGKTPTVKVVNPTHLRVRIGDMLLTGQKKNQKKSGRRK